MLVIVAEGHTAHLAMVSDGALSLVCDLGLSYPVVWAAWGDRAIYFDCDRRLLRCVDARGLTSAHGWVVPDGLDIEHVAMVGGRVFVSGVMPETRRPDLFSCALESSGANWESCYPEQFRQRKHIDALLVRGRSLIVVDNVVMPKFLFVYAEAEAAPHSSKIFYLPDHGPFEGIHSAVMTTSQIAVLSSSGGELGSCTQLFMLDLTELDDFESSETCRSLNDAGHLSVFLPRINDWTFEDRASTQPGKALYDAARHAAMAAVGESVVLGCASSGVLLINPVRISDDVHMTISEPPPPGLRSFLCLLSVQQLPTHQLASRSPQHEALTVRDVVSAGAQGCVVVLGLADGSCGSIFLSHELVSAMLA
jgi:hypothetical protein